MICPTCIKSAQRSTVRVVLVNGNPPGTASVKRKLPTDSYWDEVGVEHAHNPNIDVTIYTCSLGHRFEERSCWECPCGWMAQQAEVRELQ